MGRIAVLVIGLVGVFLWYGFVTMDLGKRPQDTPSATEPAQPRARVVEAVEFAPPAGPAASRAPGAHHVKEVGQKGARSSTTASADRNEVPMGRLRVAEMLLLVARSHVARRVYAAWGSVVDLQALRAADVDLVDRALAQWGFRLRSAIVRHRFREPKRYGLERPPAASITERRRALTVETLAIFLKTFTAPMTVDIHSRQRGDWKPGDLVLIAAQSTNRASMVAVVSDRIDAEGVPLIITMDPTDRVALENHSLANYHLRAHFRMTAAHLVSASRQLGLPFDSEGRQGGLRPGAG